MKIIMSIIILFLLISCHENSYQKQTENTGIQNSDN